MSVSVLHPSLQNEFTSTAKAFSDSLIRLGAKYKNMVLLHANKSKFLQTSLFEKNFPERFFNFGNAEQNAIGAASGFTVRGKIPVICDSALSITGRAWEQIRNSICYPNLNVKIIGAFSGLGNQESGLAMQALEDLAIMRVLPNMKILCPADAMETKKMLEVMMNDYGPTYLRLSNQTLSTLYDRDYEFEIGKGSIYKPGTDVCIFAIGTMVSICLEAAEMLEREGISTMVVNLSSLKPLDRSLIIECIKQANFIVTAEEHQTTGGLGSAIAEALADSYPCRLLRIGMDGFGESGKIEDLYKKYRLDPHSIYERIKEALKK